ncbi:MAG: 3-hydroxyacyl-ACP dehydratase FabZ [Candidatus Riflebacteria bacterium]|nr:3-hydroxyacyl-ACP dehydratase FabZ [Candidatus Riflebacteria bacterium]
MMNIEEIKEILPHRFPFLLVDRVLEVEPGKSIKAFKNVTANEMLFLGHFPHYSVMPGVLIVEAMAQASAVMFLAQEEHKGKTPFFAGIDKLKFRKQVVPGDRLDFEAVVLRTRGVTAKIAVKAYVDGVLACDGEMLCQLL